MNGRSCQSLQDGRTTRPRLDTAIKVDAYFGDTEKKEVLIVGLIQEKEIAEMRKLESVCRETTTRISGTRLDGDHISKG